MTKRDIHKAMKKANVRTAKLGDTLYVYDDETAEQVEEQIRLKAQRTGETFHRPDGVREFYTLEPAMKDGKFEWDKTGNRIFAYKFKHLVYPNGGEHNKLIMRAGFYNYDTVMEQ